MNTEKNYELAKELYASIGVDTDAAIAKADSIPISMHCWQGDDVIGFEKRDGGLTGGIQTTGNYPGRATNIEELRSDFDCASSFIPGKKRINLHAIYLDSDVAVDRTEIEYKHFESWVKWAKERDLGIDFNPTCFSSDKMKDGMTVTSPDKGVRDYWIKHCIASRHIAGEIGKAMGDTVVTNFWFPDGYKDIPVDRVAARTRLMESLDEVFAAEEIDKKYDLDSVESKVFGIGVESFTAGSNEFCLGYALSRDKLLTLDAGHFHPTEVISDKISAVMLYLKDILLHVSRPVRWDSDHVVILDDELRAIAIEIVRGGFEKRIHIGLDYFDASINRIAAWVIGTRNMRKALLAACLEPTANLQKLEAEGNFTDRLALLEEQKTMPFGAVWDYYCMKSGVGERAEWLSEVKKYEKDVLAKR